MNKLLLLCLVLLCLSCDGFQNVQVLIIDSETNKPINRVKIKELNKTILNYTDENGYCEFNRIYGFTFSRKKMTIIISKENYISDTIELENNEQRFIKMTKRENK